MMSAIASMAWGPGLRDLPRPLGDDVITIFGTRTGVYGVVNLCLALLAVLLLTLFFKHLRIGLLMRAAAENPLLASQRGVNIFLIFVGVWSSAERRVGKECVSTLRYRGTPEHEKTTTATANH